MKQRMAYLVLAMVLLNRSTQSIWACACGCGIFDIGTSSMFPTHPGGMLYTEYDYLNQDKNWAGRSSSPASNNTDKKILNNFFQIGGQYMFNRQWGMMGELPYVNRYFKTSDDDDGSIQQFTHNGIGDIRISGVYTGLSDDMSTGLTFGIKLPTGDFTYPNFDPDIQIGAGSTDLLLSAYHLGKIPVFHAWDWFANASADQPVLHYSGYIPGSETNAAAGIYYDGWNVGPVKIAPLGEVLGSYRWSDSGTLADAQNTGYSRVLLAPGIECDTPHIRVYADVGFPVYQYTTGNQLVASELFKLNIGYHF